MRKSTESCEGMQDSRTIFKQKDNKRLNYLKTETETPEQVGMLLPDKVKRIGVYWRHESYPAVFQDP